MGCNFKVLLFEYGDKLIINFSIGSVKDIQSIDLNVMNKFINEIKNILFDPKYNMILLCGHSNGMLCETLLSFTLMCYENQTLYNKFNYKFVNTKGKIFVDLLDFQHYLKQKMSLKIIINFTKEDIYIL